MPSHVVTQRTGVSDVVSAVNAGDTEALSKIADFWNTGWNLTPGQVDTSVLPSAGPYRIDSYSTDDGLVLVANERWWGNKPATDRIVVWPRGVNLTEDLDKNSIEVVDVASGSAGELGTPSGFDVQQIPSRSIEQFVLATSGSLATKPPVERSRIVFRVRLCSRSSGRRRMRRRRVWVPAWSIRD